MDPTFIYQRSSNAKNVYVMTNQETTLCTIKTRELEGVHTYSWICFNIMNFGFFFFVYVIMVDFCVVTSNIVDFH